MAKDNKLIRSDDSLFYAGHPRPGVPILIVGNTVAPLESIWFLTIAVDLARSRETVMTYARSVSLFRRAMDEAGLEYEHITKDHIIAWRDSQLSAGLEAATISLRLTVIVTFLRWLFENEIISSSPPKLLSKTPPKSSKNNNNSNVGSRAKTKSGAITRPPIRKKNKKYFTQEEFLKIRSKFNRKSDAINDRDDLMSRWGWAVGLRGMEIVGLGLQELADSLNVKSLKPGEILAALQRSEDDLFRVSLVPVRTKGNKGGDVIVSRTLMKATLEWAARGRAKIQANVARKKGDRSLGRVFISQRGLPIPRETLTANFTAAAKSADLTGRLHATRHSFISRFIDIGNRLGARNATRLAAELARHSDPRTTEIYNHVSQEENDRLVTAMIVSQIEK